MSMGNSSWQCLATSRQWCTQKKPAIVVFWLLANQNVTHSGLLHNQIPLCPVCGRISCAFLWSPGRPLVALLRGPSMVHNGSSQGKIKPSISSQLPQSSARGGTDLNKCFYKAQTQGFLSFKGCLESRRSSQYVRAKRQTQSDGILWSRD